MTDTKAQHQMAAVAREIGWQDPMKIMTCNKAEEPEPGGQMTRQRRRQAARLAAKGRNSDD